MSKELFACFVGLAFLFVGVRHQDDDKTGIAFLAVWGGAAILAALMVWYFMVLPSAWVRM